MTARPLVWIVLALLGFVILIGLWQTTADNDVVSLEPLASEVPDMGVTSSMGVWWAANEAGKGNSPLSGTDDAATFDSISAAPGAYVGQVQDMKRTNPDLRLLVYMNGAFAQTFESEAYPSHWYARDQHGNKIQSTGYRNWLMRTWGIPWQQNRARTCETLVRATGYDGCMIDVLGLGPLTPGYLSALPVDPVSQQTWLPEDWLQNSRNLIERVKTTVGEDAEVIVNGLGDGTQFYDASASTRILLDSADGAIAESWLRSPAGDVDSCPTLKDYQQDLRMLDVADDIRGDVYVLTKVWTGASEEDLSRWQRFSYASYLLAANKNTYFSFSGGRGSEQDSNAFWLHSSIGEPIGVRRSWNGLLVRIYSNGIAMVNLQAEPITVEVPEGFISERGDDGDEEVVIEPCDGETLLRSR